MGEVGGGWGRLGGGWGEEVGGRLGGGWGEGGGWGDEDICSNKSERNKEVPFQMTKCQLQHHCKLEFINSIVLSDTEDMTAPPVFQKL